MTRYKEYLRSEEYTLLACDYDVLPYYELVDVKTSVMYNGVVVTRYYSDTEPDAEMYSSCGGYSHFKPNDNDELVMLPYDGEYMFWLLDMGYSKYEETLAVAMRMYQYDEKVRVAFRHKQAGIMDADVFCKWFAKRFCESVDNKIYC